MSFVNAWLKLHGSVVLLALLLPACTFRCLAQGPFPGSATSDSPVTETAAAPARHANWREPLEQIRDEIELLRKAVPAPPLSRTVVAVRVSQRLLNSAFAKPLVLSSPVQSEFQGANITGSATLTLRASVDIETANLEGPLTIQFDGEIQTSTLASKGPARVRSRGTSCVGGSCQLLYDGQRFRHTPLKIQVITCNEICGVSSTARGLADRLIRRIAYRQATEKKHQAAQQTSQRVKDELESQGNQKLTVALNDLNRDSFFSETIQLAFGSLKNLRFSPSSSDDHVQMTVSDLRVPTDSLPAPPTTATLTAPVEFWIHSDTNPGQLAKQISILWREHSFELASVLNRMGFGQERWLTNIASTPIHTRQVDNWLVVQLGTHDSILEQGDQT